MMNEKYITLFSLIVTIIIGFVTFNCCQYTKENSRIELARFANSDRHESIEIDNKRRDYYIHIPPAYSNNKPLPLVIVFHGRGGNAKSIEMSSGFTAKANKEGFIVVYPNGERWLKEYNDDGLLWSVKDCCASYNENNDDVPFINTLIDKMKKDYNINPQKVYLTGFSSGGAISNCLACALSEKITAIAPIAGSFNSSSCKPKRPIPAIIFHGTDDKKTKYEANNHKFWVDNNKCSTEPKKSVKGNIVISQYSNCRNEANVILYTINGGKHAWPGGKKSYKYGDEPTHEISATDIMWDFFIKYPNPKYRGRH